MRESGQTIVEWLAAIAGVVALATAAAVAVPTVAPAVSGGMQTEICRATGGSCDGPSSEPARPAPQAPASPPASTPVPQPPAAPARDYCGSSWFNAPELWFTSACEGHDRCYGAHRGKAACDTAFLNDMLAICAKMGSSSSGGVSPGMSQASCRAAARLYYKAVVVGGGFSYCHRPVCREE